MSKFVSERSDAGTKKHRSGRAVNWNQRQRHERQLFATKSLRRRRPRLVD